MTNHDEPAPIGDATPVENSVARPPVDAPAGPREPRPWIERIGLAAIAAVMGALLGLMAIVAGIGGEWILAAMSASGAVLTLGVGLLTLIRG